VPTSPFVLESLVAVIAAQFPQLCGAQFILLSAGWDSVAVDADDRLIFKFPRHAEGEAGLRLEASILALVRRHVSLRVPVLELFETPRLFSRHEKIPGEHLLTAQYDRLSALERDKLADQMGLFYAELHTIGLADAQAAGAGAVDIWPDADTILRLAWPVLPEDLRPFAERTMRLWAKLSPNPHGERFGFFDGHGWNMAFDHQLSRLNGLYDFGDSGIGATHREFIYSSLVSHDLTERIILAYERHTGRPVDRERVGMLTGTHRLWELGGEAHLPDNVPSLVASLRQWAAYAG
jgi:hypothetical protein